jgi:hypothetical protein
MRVAKTALAALCNYRLLTIHGEVGQNFAFFIADNRSNRQRYDQIFAGSAMLFSLSATLATFCVYLFLEAKRRQSILILACLKDNIATVATVTAVGATFVDINLMPKTNGTITAVTCLHRNQNLIYEHVANSITEVM